MRELARLEQGALLAAIVDSTDDAIVSKDLNAVVTSWNGGAERLFGWTADEMIGETIFRLIPADRTSEEEHILSAIREGRRIETYETIRVRKGGQLIPVSLTVSPIIDSHNRIVGASKIARDISDRRRSEETRQLLMREVAHRSKNMLAIVEAIVRQTARRSPPGDFAERLSQRLRSIAASQDLLINGEWTGVEISALIESQLSHIDHLVGSRIHMQGTPLILKPSAAQALGMALHELATNALKYGALSVESGRVNVSWGLGIDGQSFTMAWTEVGGPAITEQPSAGFGETVLRRMTEGSLGGEVEHAYAPAGVKWKLNAPTSMVLAA
jgi:PAS domain S-box-containing protein